MRKLDIQEVRDIFQEQFLENPEEFKSRLAAQQVMVYVMAGGGWIGASHAERPASAYIDSRVGRRPYGRREIAQAAKVLAVMAEVAGYNPNNLPRMPNIHGSGVF